MTAGRLPHVVDALGLFQEQIIELPPSDTGVARSVQYLVHHDLDVQRQAAGIDETLEIQVFEA